MNVAELREQYDHPAWFTAIGTFVAYGLILLVMTLVLFGIPWAIFSML